MVKVAVCKLVCPACGGVLAAQLEEEIQAIGCECGHVFLAQHPDTLKKKKPTKKVATTPLPPLSLSLLEAADDVTSAVVIECASHGFEPALCRVRLGFSRRLLLTWTPLAEWNTLLRRAFAKDAAFKKFAKAEMQGIIARDAEDDEKLAQGIRAAPHPWRWPP